MSPIRDEQGEVFRMIAAQRRGPGARQFPRYRQEDGVALDTMVETFAAALLRIDSPRWDAIPLHPGGQVPPKTMTEVLVISNHPRSANCVPGQANYVRIR